MNEQRIFEALDRDQDNSALGITCSEIGHQGYSLEIDGVPISSNLIFEGGCDELEKKIGPLALTWIRGSEMEQRFAIEFLDFHSIAIRKIEEIINGSLLG